MIAQSATLLTVPCNLVISQSFLIQGHYILDEKKYIYYGDFSDPTLIPYHPQSLVIAGVALTEIFY